MVMDVVLRKENVTYLYLVPWSVPHQRNFNLVITTSPNQIYCCEIEV